MNFGDRQMDPNGRYIAPKACTPKVVVRMKEIIFEPHLVHLGELGGTINSSDLAQKMAM